MKAQKPIRLDMIPRSDIFCPLGLKNPSKEGALKKQRSFGFQVGMIKIGIDGIDID